MSESTNRSARPGRDPFASQYGWRSDGRDWPAGPACMSLDEIFAALDAITDEVNEAARLSLLAIDGAIDDAPEHLVLIAGLLDHEDKHLGQGGDE